MFQVTGELGQKKQAAETGILIHNRLSVCPSVRLSACPSFRPSMGRKQQLERIVAKDRFFKVHL